MSATALAIYIRIVPSPDQSFFDYMAWLNLHGVRFYKGSFDMTWPGEFVLHELYILIFGVHSWTARAGDFLLLQPAVAAIYAFVRRAGFPRAAIAAALLYPIIYVTSGGWMAGHRDLTGTHLLIGAAIFALPSKKGSAWPPMVAGLLVGCAVMIRPTYLAFAPMLFLMALPIWRSEERWLPALFKRGALFGAGVAAPILVFIVYAFASGTLHDWYVDSFRFVVEVYPVDASRSRLFGMAAGVLAGMFWWLTIAGVAGALLWLAVGRSRQAPGLIAAIIATIVLSYFVQNKGFGYHLGGLIPCLLVLGCAGAEAAFRLPLQPAPLRNATAGFVALILLGGTALRLVHSRPTAPDWGRQEQQRALKLSDSIRLAAMIQAESSPDDRLLLWGWEFQVAFLSQRLSATRFVNTLAARQIRPGQPLFGQWLTEFDQELNASPPKFILVDQSAIAPGMGLPVPSVRSGGNMRDILERRISRGYAIRARSGNVTLLKRVD